MTRLLSALTIFALAAPVIAGRGQITDEDRSWWAFQPVKEHAIPEVRNAAWPRTEIDRFLLARMEAAGLEPAPQAAPEVLVRRLYLTVTGLPPTPEQVAEYCNDTAPDAWERLVDRLLASPHYGEKWARFWLDLVRYAESDGYKADDYRADAWRYRDYVVNAFNTDKPYDRFVQEQIAGDELFPGDPDALTATAYARCGIYEYNNRDVAGQWTVLLNDLTDTTSDVFLGLGLQCARCHDHKFDPLLQRDYYRLQAFFAPMQPQEDTPVVTPDVLAAWQEKQAAWEQATAEVRAQIDALLEPHKKRAERDAVTKFPPETQEILAKEKDERSPLEQQLATLAFRQVTYEWERIDGKVKGADKEKLVALRKKLAESDALKPAPLPKTATLADLGPHAPPVMIPGKESRGEVLPGFPTILDEGDAAVTPLAGSTGRRSALARWITRPENPLTARVLVNRLWQQHFGRGIAAASSDFGRLGEAPTHPELLDWLAGKFVREGWSMKKLHRLILTSAAWQQDAANRRAKDPETIDPENKLLWRWPVRRLDAELIRDAVLAVTGELDTEQGGPSVDSSRPRRSIYTRVMRNTQDPLMAVFDLPQNIQSASGRDTTTTALQSLLLSNQRYLIQRGEALARRLRKETPYDEDLVIRAWQLLYQRSPDEAELTESLAFLRSQPERMDQRQFEAPAPEFVAEPMPQRAGKAAVFAPGSRQERLTVKPGGMAMPDGDFTVEAVLLLKSVYEDGRVRVVAGQWSGDKAQPGWSLGISGAGSQRKPRMPVLQLCGTGADGKMVYEPVFSDLQIQMDRTYYLAASIHFGPQGEGNVTFSLRDLANMDEPLQTTVVPHPVTGGVVPADPFVIGARHSSKDQQWDGLIDEIRITRGTVPEEKQAWREPALRPETVAAWEFEPAAPLADSVTRTPLHQPVQAPRVTPGAAAAADFCHALLGSSEFLYVR